MPLFLQKQNPNWKNSTEITGYFFANTPNDYYPPQELLNFIERGETPILITFGSMFHKQEQTKHLYQIVCESLDKSGSRAILIMPDLNEAETSSPENVYIAKQIPYSWLLGQVDMVIHHFGFGTTAEVLRAGLPSIPIPHIFDQKARASAIHKLGYATKPLNINKINSNILSNAIVQLKNNQNIKQKCKYAAGIILNENGTYNAVQLINNYIDKISNPN